VIRVNDTLQFKPDRIEVPNQCEQFTVILRHEGRLPKVASPRNWVLTEQRHADAVARDAAQTSVLTDWVNPNDPRVLAHSSVIGRDQSVRVDVPIGLLKPGVSYVYLSTIPGFSPLLRGTLTLLQ
jgi:azurin